MLARLRKSEEREGGFTLIELLVVIIIIGILAAIAIPTFLNQRKKGWRAAVKSSLKDAATSQETYFTDNSRYTVTLTDLTGTEVGFNESENVTLTIPEGDTDSYCMQAFHTSNSAEIWSISDDSGAPVSGACTP